MNPIMNLNQMNNNIGMNFNNLNNMPNLNNNINNICQQQIFFNDNMLQNGFSPVFLPQQNIKMKKIFIKLFLKILMDFKFCVIFQQIVQSKI